MWYLKLDSDKSADLRVQGLLVLKQLLWKTAPYLTPHEGSVLITLLNLRGKYPNQSHVTTGVEEICEEFLTLVDPISSIEAILTIVLPNPTEANPNPPQPPTSSWCMGLKCLAVLIKHAEWEGLEKGLGRLGKLALRSLDASDAEVRKSAVGMCVEMNARVGDEEVLFERVLRGVNGGQMNLLMYYFAKRGKGA